MPLGASYVRKLRHPRAPRHTVIAHPARPSYPLTHRLRWFETYLNIYGGTPLTIPSSHDSAESINTNTLDIEFPAPILSEQYSSYSWKFIWFMEIHCVSRYWMILDFYDNCRCTWIPDCGLLRIVVDDSSDPIEHDIVAIMWTRWWQKRLISQYDDIQSVRPICYIQW